MNWMAEAEAGLSGVAGRPSGAAATVAAASPRPPPGFWASLKLAQQAMMKAGSWFGQGAGAGEAAGAAEAASTAAKAAPKAGGVGTLSDFAEGFKNAVGGDEALAELGRSAGMALKTGVVAGVVGAAADYAARKGEEKLFGWTPENTAAARGQIEEKAHQWWRAQGVNMPWWKQPEGPPAPPKIESSRIDAAQQKARPQVDATQIEAVGAKATEAGRGDREGTERDRHAQSRHLVDRRGGAEGRCAAGKLKQVGAEAKSAGASAPCRARQARRVALDRLAA